MENDSGRKMITLDDIIRRHAANSLQPYFNWVRHLVTLALGTLTGLIALQGHYIPRLPVMKPALAICWVALLLTIVLGLVALLEEHQGPLRNMRGIKQLRSDHGDQRTAAWITAGWVAEETWTHRWATKLMLPVFLLALSSLCLFAVANFLLAAGL